MLPTDRDFFSVTKKLEMKSVFFRILPPPQTFHNLNLPFLPSHVIPALKKHLFIAVEELIQNNVQTPSACKDTLSPGVTALQKFVLMTLIRKLTPSEWVSYVPL